MRQSRRFTLINGSREYAYDSQTSYISLAESYNSYQSGDWKKGALSYLGAPSYLGFQSVIGYGQDGGSTWWPKAVFIPVEMNYNGYLLSCSMTITIKGAFYYSKKGPYNYALTSKKYSDYYRNSGTTLTTDLDTRTSQGEIACGSFYVDYASGSHNTSFTFDFTIDKSKKLTEDTALYLYLWSSSGGAYNFHAVAGGNESNTVFTVKYTCTATKRQ